MAFEIDSIETRPSKVIKEDDNRLCVGGMRNPAKSVKRLTQLAGVGTKNRELWEEFVEIRPRDD